MFVSQAAAIQQQSAISRIRNCGLNCGLKMTCCRWISVDVTGLSRRQKSIIDQWLAEQPGLSRNTAECGWWSGRWESNPRL